MCPLENTFETRELTLSMGPQHPATHGVLRLVLDLEGETVIKCTPYVGYLHRGVEKLAENRTYTSALPLTDRLDYISSMNNNVGYVNAVEKLFGIEAPERAKFIRTMVAEMGRISSHIVWLGTHVLDIGATTPFLYAFREREVIMDLFEMLCGARLTVSYPRVGGVRNDVSQEFLDKLYAFVLDFPSKMDDYETLVTENRIWKKRTVGIGVISAEEAVNWGLTGGTLRGSGVNYDVRKHAPYDAYDKVEFDVPLGKNGDCYDRYLVRMGEMRQANRIIKQCIEKIPGGPPVLSDNAPELDMSAEGFRKLTPEMSLEHAYLSFSGGYETLAPEGEVFSSTEAPKGELGFYIVSDGSGRPYRMRVRAPSFVHASAIPRLCVGHFVADVIAVIGTIDIVLGECDR
ncbi:MAG: NADH-quinone oxidoreductase subunit D [Nitrospira bacterium HGW-Nitrospira-1]|nr:MAG: NADH-quinone oxidoreductase subunit D [Nitrospira bacterium HGW-Nitrospira-1]